MRRQLIPVLFGGVSDTTAPTCTITGSVTGIASAAFTATFTFSEAVTGFALGDITVANATAGTFATVDSSHYTAVITPSAFGTVTVDVAEGVCTDAAGNTNTAATRFSIFYGVDPMTYSDGALPSPWSGGTWTIATNKAVNTPNVGTELISNGDFASDSVWSKGTGWSIGSGVATHTGSFGILSQNVMTIGRWGRAVYTVTAATTGAPRSGFGSTNMSTSRGAGGPYTDEQIQTAVTAARMICTNDASIDDVSFKMFTTSELFATVNPGVTAGLVQAAVTVQTNSCAGVVMGLNSASSPSTYVVAFCDGAYATLIKVVGGTPTILLSVAITYGAGKIVKIVRSGTTYKLYYDGAQKGADQTITDVTLDNNTIHGIFSTNPANTIDDFLINP